MKICTACNESFNDEFNFCEVCGTKLQKYHDPSEPPPRRDWSLLGIALVLGAVLITVASIIFTPKARVTDNRTKESVAVATPSQTAPATSPTTTTTVATNSDSSPATDESTTPEVAKDAESETKKKEKVKLENKDTTKDANPKAAVSDSDVNPKAAKAAVQPAEPPRPKIEPKPEPVAVEPKEPESRPRVTAPPPEPKEVKKPEEPKTASKQDVKKKDEKKKKGGFFSVFKKIFGKDN